VATYEIKFELIGNQGRVKYRDRVLLPNLMNIKGLKILRVSPIHRTNVRGTIRTVREALINEAGFGGEYGGTAIGFNHSTSKMPSNRMDLETIAADWGAASVMAYDTPMDTTDMRYHVMMPVEDLLNYTSREFRAPKDAFDGMYQNFIKNGAQAPVYVAVGKNRRIKITGNEDLVWFAKRAGLKELPVFLSYQKQV
tara:strand:- start:48 stop:635 length:588 start_codon:yes stop_codon:yes gene_type:complete